MARGDLLADTEALAARAPAGSRLVVFHTAALSYVPPTVRSRFAELVRDLGAHWIANEGRRVLPDLAEALPDDGRDGDFVLSQDGRPVAWAGPHGQSLDWFEG